MGWDGYLPCFVVPVWAWGSRMCYGGVGFHGPEVVRVVFFPGQLTSEVPVPARRADRDFLDLLPLLTDVQRAGPRPRLAPRAG